MDSSTLISTSLRWDRGTWIAALAYVERFGSTAVTAAGLHMLETVGTDDLQERARLGARRACRCGAAAP